MTARPIFDSPDVLLRFHHELEFADGIARHARRQLGLSLPLEDVTSFAREALLRAARSYDGGRGVPFRAWASLRVRGAILDGVRKHGVLPRRAFARVRNAAATARAGESGLASPDETRRAEDELTEFLATVASMMSLRFVGARADEGQLADDGETPEEKLEHAQTCAALRAAMHCLPEVERVLLERHYFGELTLEEAARSVGVSKSWGSRLHARAVQMLARELRRQRIAA